ncbi:PLP-dependent aspartate aminotransferase family protein [Kamptonema cortianum]|nr:PLP-dependent aspartate aminotransferase family protein [Geitlerinema splendidum]MDK3156133.1 PLP-dependent aspartate aminotransferase family protein [Kamptonema cortianum]
MSKRSLETQLIYLGSRPDPQHGAVCPPIVQSSTFAHSAPGVYDYDYTRTDNPTRSVLQSMLAAAEGAKHAIAVSSGMAAVDCVFSLLSAGDHVITGDDIYGGTYRYLVDIASTRGITFDFVPMREDRLRAAVRPNTKMIWFESPTNPLLNLVDIEMVVKVAKDNGLFTCIDNTFMSSYFQQPLALGVDYVMHSMTKYLNGHSDVIMGAVMTNDDAGYERLKYTQNAVGATCSPLDAFLAIRGLKTLGVRMRQHELNAIAVANHLSNHPKVEKVLFPGLPDHPHHQLGKKQMTGWGGMVSFYVKGDVEATKKFLCSTNLFTLAVSLGGVESLIEQPATMTHFEMPREVRESVGITDNLVRASIGIESADDLIQDLDQALAQI